MTDKEKIRRLRHEAVSELIRRLELDRLEGVALEEELLATALRHPSFCVEHPALGQEGQPPESNQRLEFLGDAVLGMITAHYLYLRYPKSPEGELTRIRAGLVCEKSLAAAAKTMGLGDYLQLGRGIAITGGARQASILADTFEALLGALYLCGASQKALEGYVFRYIRSDGDAWERNLIEDYKGMLQALVQKTNDRKLTYEILDEQGPDHRKMFLAGAFLDGREIGRGWGNTKQEAQKQAAKLALFQLQKQEGQQDS
ncbi:MAG: ribonuclease III [Peptococcaceae bacterium]|nr:ribonuclease III [Peptococcaceae bacterium]